MLATDARYEFVKENACKHCSKKHIKGCCDKYRRQDKTTKEYFLHVGIVCQLDSLSV